MQLALGADAIGAVAAINAAQVQRWGGYVEIEILVAALEFGSPGQNGGDSPNRICAQCELHLDLRFLPGMPRDELRAQLHERVSQALSGAELKIEWLPLFEGVEAMHTPKNAAIVQACEAWTGRPSRSVAFATEGPFFNARNLPSVILGPGDIECAHQPNEHLRRDRIAPTLDLLHKLIGRFCAT